MFDFLLGTYNFWLMNWIVGMSWSTGCVSVLSINCAGRSPWKVQIKLQRWVIAEWLIILEEQRVKYLQSTKHWQNFSSQKKYIGEVRFGIRFLELNEELDSTDKQRRNERFQSLKKRNAQFFSHLCQFYLSFVDLIMFYDIFDEN